MKKNLFFISILIAAVACSRKNNNMPPPPTQGAGYQEIPLVADVADYGAAMTDTKLLNAWGIALNPMGVVWISSNHAGATTVYDSTGKTLFGPVAIPSNGGHFGGSPTGIVFNPTTDFVIPAKNQPAKFIFVNEDGSVSAWSGGDSTATVSQGTLNAVYKGLAMAKVNNENFLFAADFRNNHIDIFDKDFHLLPDNNFIDPNMPGGFATFNIQNIGGNLYVTYAQQKGPEKEDDQPGMGNGYVNVFSPDGTLLKRFASQGTLNSPWGLAQAPDGSGLPLHSILVGNFGDGHINIYDSTGVYRSQLQSNGQPIVINGLWALDFPFNEAPMSDPRKIYFTAGPMDEEHGLFGALKMQ